MKHLLVAATAVAAAPACRAVEAAQCDRGDWACLMATAEPGDVRAAVEYVGPCYSMARAACDRLEFCTGALTSRQACVDEFVDTVCAAGAFDPATMDRCATWSRQLDCSYYYDPGPAHAAYDAHHQAGVEACWDTYEHPLGGAAAYEEPPPPGA